MAVKPFLPHKITSLLSTFLNCYFYRHFGCLKVMETRLRVNMHDYIQSKNLFYQGEKDMYVCMCGWGGGRWAEIVKANNQEMLSESL